MYISKSYTFNRTLKENLENGNILVLLVFILYFQSVVFKHNQGNIALKYSTFSL
jgi:hypothetical protein